MHSAVVRVSYKTTIEHVSMDVMIYFMNVNVSGKPHDDLNSFHSWPGNPVLKICAMNSLFIASDSEFFRSSLSCLYLSADFVKAFLFALSESEDKEILVSSSFSRLLIICRAFPTSESDANEAGSHSRHLQRSLHATLLVYPLLLDHFLIPALVP